MAGEARSRQSSSAASSRALPGAVTKARDCGVTVARTGLALPAAAWGLSLCLSGSLHQHKPRWGNLPQVPGTRWAFRGISGMIPLGPLWAARKQELPRITPRRQHAASLILQKRGKPRPGRSLLEEEVSPCILGRQFISSHLTGLLWDLLDVFWKLNSAGARSGTSELDSQVLGQLW